MKRWGSNNTLRFPTRFYPQVTLLVNIYTVTVNLLTESVTTQYTRPCENIYIYIYMCNNIGVILFYLNEVFWGFTFCKWSLVFWITILNGFPIPKWACFHLWRHRAFSSLIGQCIADKSNVQYPNNWAYSKIIFSWRRPFDRKTSSGKATMVTKPA